MDNDDVLPPVAWKQIADQLRDDPDSMPRSERVSLLTGQTEAWGSPSDEMIAVLELLARDPKWEVRREVAEILSQLPEALFSQLASTLMQDQNHYVRKAAERALDRRRRGEKNALARNKKSGELAAEYDSMERLYGTLPTRKARRIVEKHFDMLVGGTVHNMRGLLTPIKHNAEELSALAQSGSIDKRKLGQHASSIVTRLPRLIGLPVAERAPNLTRPLTLSYAISPIPLAGIVVITSTSRPAASSDRLKWLDLLGDRM